MLNILIILVLGLNAQAISKCAKLQLYLKDKDHLETSTLCELNKTHTLKLNDHFFHYQITKVDSSDKLKLIWSVDKIKNNHLFRGEIQEKEINLKQDYQLTDQSFITFLKLIKL